MNKFIALIFTLFIVLPVWSLDYSGDFSSRSVLINNINRQDKLTQEQRDVIIAKKLTPSARCLIEQTKRKNIENIQILMAAGVNPNESTCMEYAIYIAAKNNSYDIAKLLIENGAKLDRGFNSELYEAVRNKNSKMALMFLENGARIDYSDSVTNNTILYLALKNNMLDVAQMLIEKGAPYDVRSARIIKNKKLMYLFDNVKVN